MSLFPAYTSETDDFKRTSVLIEEEELCTTAQWLENASFPLQEEELKKVQDAGSKVVEISSDEETSDSDLAEVEATQSAKRPKRHKEDKRKRHQHQHAVAATPKTLDFTGDEDYYVDKKPARQYLSLNTLLRPVVPRYRRVNRRPLGQCFIAHRKSKYKRYYKSNLETDLRSSSGQTLSEEEYTEQVGRLNRRTMEKPTDLAAWIELVELQQKNPHKPSKLLVAEKQLDLLQKALMHLPKNDRLYECYIEVINATYPAFEVSKMLDKLLYKNPYSYTLWTAQIMATQCTMARCVVPDVLQIYERCMQKMHHKQRNEGSSSNEILVSDDVMLKLFNNCALFLRQAGLMEQFFALLQLALELNVSTDRIEQLQAKAEDQATLLEYEELVLQSGLPMTEIWSRIERLRQSYNFLPLPERAPTSDPQRIVFNEDICHYVYPLKSRDNAFYLILLILRLVKLPFVQTELLAEKFCARVQHIGDSDAVEDALAGCLRNHFIVQRQPEFLRSLFGIAREMAVTPTFLSNSLGHEIYIRCLTQLLLNCAAAYEGRDERKRLALLQLWCRFERLLLLQQKCQNKLNTDFIKAGRSRFKALLKQTPNRNAVNLYTEFAIYEYEALPTEESKMQEGLQKVRGIFVNLLASHSTLASEDGSVTMADVCQAFAVYAEILIEQKLPAEALRVLVCFSLNLDLKSATASETAIGDARKLAALQSLSTRLQSVFEIEKNVEIMTLEQHFLPDHAISLLKMHTLLQQLLGKRLEALGNLEQLLREFKRSSDRHSFLREQILEIYMAMLMLKGAEQCSISSMLVASKVTEAMQEFPRNLFFMECAAAYTPLLWFKVRGLFLNANHVTVVSIIFLVAMARYRFMHRFTQNGGQSLQLNGLPSCCEEVDLRAHQANVRNRLLSLFVTLTERDSANALLYDKCDALRRNALFWRLYLSLLGDLSTSFEVSKRCLLRALDECPWTKALYMDGAILVPQELPHLQDLLIEKQMRIYALPDELEILRER